MFRKRIDQELKNKFDKICLYQKIFFILHSQIILVKRTSRYVKNLPNNRKACDGGK
ncbi:hypothetical protein SAMN05421544_10741 [Riemerella columbipharyngis]|uniref:Uncharacterized protein n=1 Tax=Riemerella columbipharyngis TaxID=1071918 RepID=A0A1G7C3P6_9FLAO|nr:hypothetical protein SAMN05421544_10741 [Riemerella columbipharyngis]